MIMTIGSPSTSTVKVKTIFSDRGPRLAAQNQDQISELETDPVAWPSYRGPFLPAVTSL